MEKIANWMTRFIQIVLVILMIVLVLDVFAQVIFRYVLLAPLTWSSEIANLLLLYISFLGSILLVGDKGHMAVDFFKQKMSVRLRKIVDLFIHIALLIVFIILFYYGARFTQLSAHGISPALQISVAWNYVVLPITGLGSIIYLIVHIINDLKQWKSNESYSYDETR